MRPGQIFCRWRKTPTHWAGHFRLAHLAGLAGDADGFKQHLMNAIEHGFDLETVQSDPDWVSFTKNRKIRPVLRKVIVLYGNDVLCNGLETNHDLAVDGHDVGRNRGHSAWSGCGRPVG